MDTRTKIIDAQQARQIEGAIVVSGYFDPLLASHAARLKEVKHDGPLIVAIASTADSILPARARAELVAGLRDVDYVTESVEGLSPAVKLEQEDAVRLEKLIEHVHSRQQAAS